MSYRDLQDIGIKDEHEAVLEIELLRNALRTILSDLEMGDGDGARRVAEEALKPQPR